MNPLDVRAQERLATITLGLALALLGDVRGLREDLRLVAMSATVQAQRFAALLDDEEFARTVGHELADVLYFVLLMCANMGLDASQLLKEKLAISGERYPVEKARGRNLKYTELSRLTQEEEKE